MVATRASSALLVLTVAVLALANHAEAIRHRRNGDLCSHTDYPRLCRTMVRGKVGAARATQSIINSLIRQTKQAMALAARAKTRSNGQMIEVCLESYDDVVDSLMASLQNMKSHDKGSLGSNLSAVISDFESCSDAFAEFPRVRSPLKKLNTILEEIASDALALSTEVH